MIPRCRPAFERYVLLPGRSGGRPESCSQKAFREHDSSPPTRRRDLTAPPSLHPPLHSCYCDANSVQKATQRPSESCSRTPLREPDFPLPHAVSPIERMDPRTLAQLHHGIHQMSANGASRVDENLSARVARAWF